MQQYCHIYFDDNNFLVRGFEKTHDGLGLMTADLDELPRDVESAILGKCVLNVLTKFRVADDKATKVEWEAHTKKLLTQFGVRSWRQLSRQYRAMAIYREGHGVEVVPMRRESKGKGHERDLSHMITCQDTEIEVGSAIFQAMVFCK